ncbi:UDP-2,3-diacylglucosamine diphosphatase [Rudaea cellulosilytica]|uniref:UDP-2,3-diacylglucosamine diphosphatase n=1 Tax=Rudaea cellulosilytica TaxID=540746 RepID=UPI00036C7B67|nr:UDP-2,3-diacylglucosamine diphosphatase [Rudaea cellulosilytica]
MATLLISDLHLDPQRPRIMDLFADLLAGEARRADALYILGDLFDSWIGDDDDAALATQVAQATRALRDSGVPIWFMHGNRDFLLGADYAARAGMSLLADPSVVELGGERVLLMHGDTLCTDDTEYLKFRALVRDPRWQAQFLAKPLAERRAFAAQARGESQKHTSAARPEIMDVNQEAVVAAMRAHGVRRLIHGHTHRPATHRFQLDGHAAERVVLGDWYEQDSVLRLS